MNEQEFYNEMMGEYYAELDTHRDNVKRINDRLLRAIKHMKGKYFHDDVLSIMEDSETQAMYIVNKPKGSKQKEGYEVIKKVWVDQWTGYECDDYHGVLYVKLKKGKYLAIPYCC